jgi:capsular exopolysaccharide synthesis family protein
MAKKYELDIRDYLRILRKRKAVIIFTTLMLGIFSFFFATLQKPIPLYKASSSVKVERSSTATGLYLESISYSDWDSLEAQATIIRSYPVMEIVAKKLGLLKEDLTSDEIRQNNQYLNIVLDIKDKVTTAQEGNTNIIDITVTSEEPDFCQRAANIIAEAFKEQNIYEKNKRAISARKFIEEQLKVVSVRLKEAEEKIRSFMEENKLVSLPDQSRIVLDQLTRAEVQYNELNKSLSEMALMEKQLKELKAIPKETLEGVVAERVGPIFQRLNTQLLDLNIKKDSLLLIYTEKHPEVQDVNEQISNVTKNMLSQLTAQRDTIQRGTNALKSEIDKLREQLQLLPEKGLLLARLERDQRLNTEVYTLLEQKYQEALIKEAEKIEEVSIIKPALMPTSPINPPQTASITFVGMVLGIILGLVFAFIMETMDTSIETIDGVEAYLEVPVLGIIPYVHVEDIKEILAQKGITGQSEDVLDRNARLITHFAPKSTLAESYRALRTNIQFSCIEQGAKLILLTSSLPGEGKSATAMNLAMVLAQGGSKTLLMDADLRKPVVNKVFGLDREPGLADVIIGNYEWQEVVRTVTDIMIGKMGMEDIMTTPGIDNLSIITSGTIPPNPSELVNSPRIPVIFAQLKENYDIVIVDTTPILPATDAAILAKKTDGVIIVYQVGKIARGSLKRAKGQMDTVKAKVLGIVLNGLRPESSTDYRDYKYQSYYSYGSEQGKQKEKSWIPLFDSIKKVILPRKEGKEKGKRESSVIGGALKMLTLIIAVSFMLLGILYKADYKKGREETAPIASLQEQSHSLPKENILMGAVIIALITLISLISRLLIKNISTPKKGKTEDIKTSVEKESIEKEKIEEEKYPQEVSSQEILFNETPQEVKIEGVMPEEKLPEAEALESKSKESLKQNINEKKGGASEEQIKEWEKLLLID